MFLALWYKSLLHQLKRKEDKNLPRSDGELLPPEHHFNKPERHEFCFNFWQKKRPKEQIKVTGAYCFYLLISYINLIGKWVKITAMEQSCNYHATKETPDLQFLVDNQTAAPVTDGTSSDCSFCIVQGCEMKTMKHG